MATPRSPYNHFFFKIRTKLARRGTASQANGYNQRCTNKPRPPVLCNTGPNLHHETTKTKTQNRRTRNRFLRTDTANKCRSHRHRFDGVVEQPRQNFGAFVLLTGTTKTLLDTRPAKGNRPTETGTPLTLFCQSLAELVKKTPPPPRSCGPFVVAPFRPCGVHSVNQAPGAWFTE